MTNNEVHEQLIEWLGDLLGVTVIKDRQQANRPPLPYGMVDLANWRDLDANVTDLVYADAGDDVLATPIIEMEWVFLFFLYGAQAETLIRRVSSAVHLLQVQEPMRAAGLIIHDVSGANSIPEMVGEHWEPRVQVNISVRGMSGGEGFSVDIVEDFEFNISREGA